LGEVKSLFGSRYRYFTTETSLCEVTVGGGQRLDLVPILRHKLDYRIGDGLTLLSLHPTADGVGRLNSLEIQRSVFIDRRVGRFKCPICLLRRNLEHAGQVRPDEPAIRPSNDGRLAAVIRLLKGDGHT